MIDEVNLKEVSECLMELDGRVEILSGKDMASCVSPESLNDIEIRRIRRQKYEIDSAFCRLVLYGLTMLVTGVGENDGNRNVSRFRSYFFQESSLSAPHPHKPWNVTV